MIVSKGWGCTNLLVLILFGCFGPSQPSGPGPESDCPIPIPTWTHEEHEFNQVETLKLLAELSASAQLQARQLQEGGQAGLSISPDFKNSIELHSKKSFVISQSATQAALAMRELQCAIWRKNISAQAAQQKLLDLVDLIAGVEAKVKSTSNDAPPRPTEHNSEKRELFVEASVSTWQPSGVYLQPGETAHVTASGKWGVIDPTKRGLCGPGGNQVLAKGPFMFQDAGQGCLLMRDSTGGIYPWRGDNDEITVSVPGAISFIANDDQGSSGSGFADNIGKLAVTIRIERR